MALILLPGPAATPASAYFQSRVILAKLQNLLKIMQLLKVASNRQTLYNKRIFALQISDQQQSWGYEGGLSKGPGPGSDGGC
jgi:hypothetical protein